MRRIHLILLVLLALPPGCRLAAQPPRPAAGMFLVAQPDLRDPNFAHSVVLLFDHGEHGAAGVIVNRPTEARLDDLLPEVEGAAGLAGKVYLGGPVLPEGVLVLMRAGSAPEGAREVFDDVYVSADRELLARLVQGGGVFRVYAGYAGWAAGQLEWEIRQGGWALVPADAEAVFGDDPQAVWRKMLRRATSPLASLPPSAAPEDRLRGPRPAVAFQSGAEPEPAPAGTDGMGHEAEPKARDYGAQGG